MTHQVQFVLLIYSRMWDPGLEHGWPTSGHTLKENSLSLAYQLVNGSSAGGRDLWVPLSSMLLCADWLSLVQVVGRQPQLRWVHEYLGPVTSRKQFPSVLPDLWLLKSSQPTLPQCSLNLGKGIYRCPIYVWTLHTRSPWALASCSCINFFTVQRNFLIRYVRCTDI